MPKLKIRSFISLAVLAGVLMPALTFAGDADTQSAIVWPKSWPAHNIEKYPPYPDVWGREIPSPLASVSSPEIFDVGIGDRIIYDKWHQKPENGSTRGTFVYYFQEFFSGNFWHATKIDEQIIVRNKKIQPFPPRGNLSGIPLSDGSHIRISAAFLAKDYPNLGQCFDIPMFQRSVDYLSKRKPPPDVLWERLVIRLRPEMKDMGLNISYCEPKGQDVFKLTYPGRVHFWGFSILDSYILKDETFLSSGFDSNDEQAMRHIIRFDADLRSPYLDQRGDFYILNIEEIRPILKEANERFAKHSVELHTFIDERITAYVLKRGKRP